MQEDTVKAIYQVTQAIEAEIGKVIIGKNDVISKVLMSILASGHVLLDDVMLGDTDGDGYVNISDVTHIQRHLAELESLEGIYLHAADANQDGTLDISDATTLQMYLAKYDIPYPIGEVMTQ